MNNQTMRCPTCGNERVSRYAAYCHVCGNPLPELPPSPEDEAALNEQGYAPVDPAPAPPPAQPRQVYAAPPITGAAVPPPQQPVQQQPVAQQPPGGQTPPPPPGGGGAVRVYDRPEVPPSVQRRKKLTIIMAVVGVLISLLLLGLGPLRSALSTRSDPAWAPPGTETPVGGISQLGTATAGLPPGLSAAQATAQARRGTATAGPTWTAGVDIGGTSTMGGEGALPTLAPAATTTPRPTNTSAPTATAAPTATTAPTATAAPTATTAPTATLAPTATVPPTGEPGAAALPVALSGGKAMAFVSDRSGSPQIWVMTATGDSQLQVTTQGRNTSPTWSADNRFLYYVSDRDGATGVFRLDVTTGREERLVSDAAIVSARPLPNGQLATVRMENGLYTLYVGDRRLFQLDRAFQFQFSPDGSRALIDPTAAPRVITVVDVASTQAAEVAPANSWNAGWGPGNQLVYVSDRSGIAAVYVAGPNGEDARPISPGDKWSQAPAFSSDGGQIAFVGGDGPAWNVYVVSASGGAAQRVGGPTNPGKSPVWQPAGGLIAFESDRAGNWDIYVTDAQGNERALTNHPGNDVDPAWTW